MRVWMQHLMEAEGESVSPEGAAAFAAANTLAKSGALEGPVVIYNTAVGSKYAEIL
jgi:threonine synthase